MAPLTPTTLTRLDPAYPVLWRDAQTLQLGADAAMVVDAEDPWVEPLLRALSEGFRRSAFDVIAHSVGAPRAEARALLQRLHPLLRDDQPDETPLWVDAINLSDARAEARMREALLDEGFPDGSRVDLQHIGIILIEGAAAALQLAPYLRADLPHLPVAFDAGGVTVGPLVVPGKTPCLSCRDGHDRDRDAAWPLLHAQLVARAAGPLSSARVAEGASLVARLLRSPRSDVTPVAQLTADGTIEWRSVTFHAECRCREQSFRSPRESETAHARRDLPRATTRSPEFARRA